jgi:hypothetical protein
MTSSAGRSRARRTLLVAFGLAIACTMAAVVPPRPAAAATVWSKNLYRSAGFVTQDPYMSACVAAATMMMLNFIDLSDTGGEGFRWTTYRTKKSSDRNNYRDMTSIFWYARAHDTLAPGPSGSDTHGWRNTLNAYGWGSAAMRDPDLRVYDDRQFSTFGSAVKAAVRAIAMFEKPVGILGSAGGHAQVMTGYVVTGEDPAVSDAFTVNYVYLTDPLKGRWIRNKKLSLDSFRSGSSRVRFRRYYQGDSPRDDVYTAGWRRSSVVRSRGASEWYGKYVLVLPIRDGLPTAEPAPELPPPPDPSAGPDPSPSDDASGG